MFGDNLNFNVQGRPGNLKVVRSVKSEMLRCRLFSYRKPAFFQGSKAATMFILKALF